MLPLQRGHWFEDGIAQALPALHMPLARQLEMALDVGDCPVRAPLDFVLASATPRPTVRVLEVKSMARLPDHLCATHEAQVYGQIGLLARCWNTRAFSLKDEPGGLGAGFVHDGGQSVRPVSAEHSDAGRLPERSERTLEPAGIRQARASA